MGKKAPKAPKINYGAQSQMNQEIFRTNIEGRNPTTYNPWGSVTYSGTPGEGDYTQTVSLSPEQQRIFENQMGIGGTRSDIARGISQQLGFLEQPVDYSQFQEVGNYDARRQSAEDAAYGRIASRLDPQFQEQEQAMDVRLRSQGLQPGDQAYDNAMGNLLRSKNDAYANAQRDAVEQGRSESQLAFSQQTMQRKDQIAEELQRRGWGLNEINALMQGQGINMPTAGQTGGGQMEGIDMNQDAMNKYQAAVNKYNADNANTQSAMSAAAMAAAAYFSDIRLKSCLKFVASIGGFKYYTWKWNEVAKQLGINSPEFGVLAQDIEHTRPELVRMDSNGYLTVNYGGLF